MIPTQQSDVFSFIKGLQAALTVAELSDVYVAAATGLLFARGRGLYKAEGPEQAFIGQAADVPQPLLDEYASVCPEQDPVLQAAISSGRPAVSSDKVLAERWESSRAHAVLNQFGYAHSMKAPVIISGELWGSIHFTRFREDPPFTSVDRTAATVIGEQVGVALARVLRHEATLRENEMLVAALNTVCEPVLISDTEGRVTHRNRASLKQSGSEGRRVGDVLAPAVNRAATLLSSGDRRVVNTTVDDGLPAQMSVRSIAVGCQGAVTIGFPTGSNISRALPTLGVLSRREREIAQLVSEGLSTAAIARRAFITENTVKQHLKRMFAKLSVRSRAELVQVIWASAGSGVAVGAEVATSRTGVDLTHQKGSSSGG